LKAYWQAKLQPAYACLDKLAKMPLSAFGRAFGAGGYALSTVLYHAEFMGLPPDTMLRQLNARTAAVVDRKGNRLTGVPGNMLIGRPAEGGFGLMPLQLHVQARHAWWALALLRAPLHGWPPPPWVWVARSLITSIQPVASPFTLLNQRQLEAAGDALPLSQRYQRDGYYADAVAACPPAHRLFTALQIADIRRFKLTASPKLGKWIRHAPIWSNPMLWDHNQNSPEWQKHFIMQSFKRNAATTVGDAINAMDLNALAVIRSVVPTFAFNTYHPELLARRNVDRSVEEEQLYNMIPQQWRQWCQGPAAPLQLQLGPQGWQAEAKILQHIRFSCFPAQGFDPLPAISVRKLTAIQMYSINGPRFRRLTAYATEAGCTDPTAAAKRLKIDIFRQVWSLPWENKYKEILWRLAVNGVAMYGSARYMADQPPLPCLCGTGLVSRTHHYWECPIATAVMQEVQLGWKPATTTTTVAGSITREQLWMLHAPHRTTHDIWQVVVLAALNAMDAGRRRLTSICMTAREQHHRHPTQQPQATQARISATAEQLQLACVFATERFWSNLRDFAVLNHHRPPKRWVSQLSESPAHPFFEVQQLPPPPPQQQQHEESGQREWRLYAKARPQPSIILPDTL
jgi:hypothetical protein